MPLLSCVVLTSLSLSGSQRPNHKLSAFTRSSYPVGKAPLLAIAATLHLVLNLMDVTVLPACKIIQTSQSHCPMESRGYPTSFSRKACLPQPLLVHLLPSCSPPVTLHGM